MLTALTVFRATTSAWRLSPYWIVPLTPSGNWPSRPQPWIGQSVTRHLLYCTTSVLTTASITCRCSVTSAFFMPSSWYGHLLHSDGMQPIMRSGFRWVGLPPAWPFCRPAFCRTCHEGLQAFWHSRQKKAV